MSSKAVDFMIYNLKHFIGSCFDVYFFLWNNGAHHWEREKFLWEQEQLREWNYVQSRKQKKVEEPKTTELPIPAEFISPLSWFLIHPKKASAKL
jgi:hypothetical protein